MDFNNNKSILLISNPYLKGNDPNNIYFPDTIVYLKNYLCINLKDIDVKTFYFYGERNLQIINRPEKKKIGTYIIDKLFLHLKLNSNKYERLYETFNEQTNWLYSLSSEEAWRIKPLILSLESAKEKIVKIIGENKIKIVGFSNSFSSTLVSLYFATMLRHMFKDIIVIFGGADFNEIAYAELLLKIFPNIIDVIVHGDGEETLLKLVRKYLYYEQLE
ncbi:MAG: hypothetical protein ACFFDN_18950, partial [Candidatus Hodarchaeota archaeon]